MNAHVIVVNQPKNDYLQCQDRDACSCRIPERQHRPWPLRLFFLTKFPHWAFLLWPFFFFLDLAWLISCHAISSEEVSPPEGGEQSTPISSDIDAQPLQSSRSARANAASQLMNLSIIVFISLNYYELKLVLLNQVAYEPLPLEKKGACRCHWYISTPATGCKHTLVR